MSRLNIKKDFVDGKVLPAQDLNNNFKQIEKSIDDLKGETAYQIAVRNGFIGTEEEWLKHLSDHKDNKVCEVHKEMQVVPMVMC